MELNKSNVVPTLAVTDMDRARRFYGETLGLREVGSINTGDASRDLVFELGNNSHLCLYERPMPSGSTATACSFEVNDVEAAVRTLRDKGVEFEEYDMPEMGLKTKKGIATMGPLQAAWFRDPDGNILAIGNGLAIRQRGVSGRKMTKTA